MIHNYSLILRMIYDLKNKSVIINNLEDNLIKTIIKLQKINKNISSYDKSEELTYEQIKKIEHYESKKQGLYEITKEKIREELYNNKNLFELN